MAKKPAAKSGELAHSPIGASSMERWASCAGSIRLSKGIRGRESAYALEGTKAHELAATILTCKLSGQDWYDEDVDPEMLEAVMVYVDEVMSDAEGNTVLIEEKCDLSSLHPGLFGTCDNVTFVKKEKLLKVRDYKHGAGIAVDVKDNQQLLYYSLAALLTTEFPCEEVEMMIVQPRAPHPDGPIRSWRISSLELMDFASTLKEAALATEDPHAPLVPGDHCRFCPAAGVCPAIKTKAQELAKREFSESSLQVADLASTLEWVPILEAWAKNVHEFAYAQAQKGVKIPGWKLVAKRPTRKWIDEQAVKRFAEQEFSSHVVRSLYEDPAFKSVAHVEKVLHEKQWPKLTPFISAVSSGEVLVPESDKRPEILIRDAKTEFAELDLID